MAAMMADSGDKMYAPTARRVADARRTGQFPASRALATGVALLVALTVLIQYGQAALGTWILCFRRALDRSTQPAPFRAAFVDAARTGWSMLGLPLVALATVACLIGILQSRGRWWPAPRSRSFISWSSVFRRERALDAGKAVVTLVVLVGVVYWATVAVLPPLLALYGASAARVLSAVGALGRHLGLRLGIAALALGVADYLWKRHAHRKALRMNPDELKREHKETEGEPLSKAKRRRIHEETLAELAEIAGASLVVSGPALAVAIHHDGEHAPRIVAKAQGQRIYPFLLAARAALVPVVERSDVALALSAVNAGSDVPAHLYDALAELFVDAGIAAVGRGPAPGAGVSVSSDR
jgi:flagellar biosynthesis protein FlhB